MLCLHYISLYFLVVTAIHVPCRSWRVVKLSCVGSIGLSFMGTLRATQIRHDWKSKKKKKRRREDERGDSRADPENLQSKEKVRVGDITKTRAETEGGWEGHKWQRQREGKNETHVIPSSIINTVINEHGDQGSAPFMMRSSYCWRGKWWSVTFEGVCVPAYVHSHACVSGLSHLQCHLALMTPLMAQH